MKYDLSIVLPGIRKQNWVALYNSVIESVGDYSWEMIISGPGAGPEDYPPELNVAPNFTFLQDFRAPAPTTQRAVTYASGEYFTWGSDDGVFLPNALKESLDLLKTKSRKDGIIMRYSEGNPLPGDEYWMAETHKDLRLPGVGTGYYIAPVGMYNLDYFRELGGWDCRYEHLNMCCHDLAFRLQNDGGKLYLSPGEVLKCSWTPDSKEHIPIHRAYHENDRPIWDSMYNEDQSNRVKIDYDNWKATPEVWDKRFRIINE